MPRTSTLLEKSIAACISGIEMYNKPDFKYREEIFSILMINAWELLLKAKIIKDNDNNPNSIFIRVPKTLVNGTKSKKQFVFKTARSGNSLSIELLTALDLVAREGNGITQPLRENIIALCEIRDNAIHFKNGDVELHKVVLELGTASLKNYLNAVKHWFNKDLSKYNFYLMPLSFFHEFENVTDLSLSKPTTQLNRLLNYVGQKALEIKSNPEHEYNLLLEIETKFVKSKLENSLNVTTVRSREDAINPELVREILLTEEDITQKFPWTKAFLCDALKKRYTSFKQDKKFNTLIKQLKSYKEFCHQRRLSPNNPKSAVIFLYNPNCLISFFDKHYNV